MISFDWQITDINKYQKGNLPANSRKIDTPSTEKMQIYALPIAGILSAVCAVAMFVKTNIYHRMVFNAIALIVGFGIGFILLVAHEWLHAVIYPKKASVTIGKAKGKIMFVALGSYPLKRGRFILMSLFPFILGIVPLVLFMISPGENLIQNGLLFGMACMGMVSPYPDVYNVITALRNSRSADQIMFYEDDMYRIEP